MGSTWSFFQKKKLFRYRFAHRSGLLTPANSGANQSEASISGDPVYQMIK